MIVGVVVRVAVQLFVYPSFLDILLQGLSHFNKNWDALAIQFDLSPLTLFFGRHKSRSTLFLDLQTYILDDCAIYGTCVKAPTWLTQSKIRLENFTFFLPLCSFFCIFHFPIPLKINEKFWEKSTVSALHECSVCSTELIRWSGGLQLDQFGLNEENDRFFSERQAVLLPSFRNSFENISSFLSIEAISRGDIFRVKKAITTLTMSESCCLLH